MFLAVREGGKVYGGVAQLGERTVRIRKVESSILFVSTKKKDTTEVVSFLFYCPAFRSKRSAGLKESRVVSLPSCSTAA